MAGEVKARNSTGDGCEKGESLRVQWQDHIKPIIEVLGKAKVSYSFMYQKGMQAEAGKMAQKLQALSAPSEDPRFRPQHPLCSSSRLRLQEV